MEETPPPAGVADLVSYLNRLSVDIGRAFLAGADAVAGHPADEVAARLYHLKKYAATLRPPEA